MSAPNIELDPHIYFSVPGECTPAKTAEGIIERRDIFRQQFTALAESHRDLLAALRQFNLPESMHAVHPETVACNICNARRAIARAEGAR